MKMKEVVLQIWTNITQKHLDVTPTTQMKAHCDAYFYKLRTRMYVTSTSESWRTIHVLPLVRRQIIIGGRRMLESITHVKYQSEILYLNLNRFIFTFMEVYQVH